jgi:DNA phosphorothioation-associated putative methyltransferase
MDYALYKGYLKRLAFGKKIKNFIYVYRESLLSADKELLSFADSIKSQIKGVESYNVIKFDITKIKLSFLSYKNFLKIPHPVLQYAVIVDYPTDKIRKYNYINSKNPPILHRKETLLEPSHHLVRKFNALTEAEEKMGLYDNPKIIGFKRNWEQLLVQSKLYTSTIFSLKKLLCLIMDVVKGMMLKACRKWVFLHLDGIQITSRMRLKMKRISLISDLY